MHPPHPPRPPYPPRPAGTPGEPDRDLVARLATPDGHARAVAVLLARHWSAARDYAAVCLATPHETAQLVATAAVHHVLGRLAAGRGGGALRPQILVAVRDTVRGWASDGGISALLPELRKTTGGRGLRATSGGTPEKRQLAERAFRALPGAAQCLLWHTEVEAEPISVPAGLLGVDPGTAAAALEQAREQFRAGCVRAHRELAPTPECRFHNRLLDIPLRRGGHLLPDVRRHLAECRYCRHAAEQLSHFDGALGILLAETVLGWGARRYLDSRPGRLRQAPPGAPGRPGGRHRGAPPGRPDPLARHTRAVLAGVGLTALALLVTVLATQSRSADNAVPGTGTGARSATGTRTGAAAHSSTGSGHGPTWGAPAGSTTTTVPRPSAPAADPPPPGAPPGAGAAPLLQGRLLSPALDRCLDAGAGHLRPGAAVGLADCSTAASQRWTYGADGLVRSAADPALCLGADPLGRRVTLADCADRTSALGYDLTVRGELLPRRWSGFVVAPADGAGGEVTVQERDGSARQRWVFGSGEDVPPARQPEARPDGGAPPAAPGGQPTYQVRRAPQAPPGAPEFAPVDCCAPRQPAPPARPSALGVPTVTAVVAAAPVAVPRTHPDAPKRRPDVPKTRPDTPKASPAVPRPLGVLPAAARR